MAEWAPTPNMRSFLIVLAIVIALTFAFARYVRRAGMFFPERHPNGLWDTSALDVQPVDHYFTTSDGVRLHGWLFRSTDAAAPTIVWFHGNGGNVTHRGDLAANLAARGVPVFVFDWRGYGRSEGSPSEGGLFRDALAAYDYATQTLKARDVIVYGESLGGPYAAYVATKRRVRAVIIENSFPSLRALGNALYHPIPLGWTAPRALPTTRWLNQAGVPVLVMHGRRDGVIPYRLGVELYEGLRVPKEMLTSDSAGHSEIPSVEGRRYYDAVVRFAQR